MFDLFSVLVLFIGFQEHIRIINAKDSKPTICSPNANLILNEGGKNSSKTILLDDNQNKSECIMLILGPPSHYVHMQFDETTLDIHKAWTTNSESIHIPCILKVFLPDDDRPVWEGDLCSFDVLPPVGLLTPEIRLQWEPPLHIFNTKGRKIRVTAVGKGETCNNPDQHVCSRIGWKADHCVSSEFICDDIEHCPNGSTLSDEDKELCKQHKLVQSSWQHLALDYLKKFKPSPSLSGISNKWIQDQIQEHASSLSTVAPIVKGKTHLTAKWQNLVTYEASTKAPVIDASDETFGTILAQYGPWGYLLIGMILGAILIFCGVWECCFRRPKREVSPISNLPATVVMMYGDGDVVSTHQPPNYDDLDQPPSYVTLFPNNKLNVINVRHSEVINPSDLNRNSLRRDTVSESNLDSINELCALNGVASQSTDHYDNPEHISDTSA